MDELRQVIFSAVMNFYGMDDQDMDDSVDASELTDAILRELTDATLRAINVNAETSA